MLRVAHIGAGTFSRRAHAPALRRLADEPHSSIRLAGISDVDVNRPQRARQFAQDFGYEQSFDDWRVMLDQARAHIIVCVVEPAAAAAVLAEIIPLRIPVITEKPPALTVREATQLARLADACGTTTYVTFNRRRMPSIERARDWHRQLGAVTRVRAEMFRARAPEPNFCVTTAVHAFDTVRYLAGEIETVSTRCLSSHRDAINYFVTAQCAGRVTAEIDIRVGADSTREAYFIESATQATEVVLCPPYSASCEWTGLRCTRGPRLGTRETCVGDVIEDGGIVQQYRRFLECVTSGGTPDCTIGDASMSLRVAAAVAAGYTGALSEFDQATEMTTT
jgi:predicted dehydrogenase